MNTQEIREKVRKACKYPVISPESVDAMIDHADYHHVAGYRHDGMHPCA